VCLVALPTFIATLTQNLGLVLDLAGSIAGVTLGFILPGAIYIQLSDVPSSTSSSSLSSSSSSSSSSSLPSSSSSSSSSSMQREGEFNAGGTVDAENAAVVAGDYVRNDDVAAIEVDVDVDDNGGGGGDGGGVGGRDILRKRLRRVKRSRASCRHRWFSCVHYDYGSAHADAASNGGGGGVGGLLGCVSGAVPPSPGRFTEALHGSRRRVDWHMFGSWLSLIFGVVVLVMSTTIKLINTLK
jgi:hypothetical protein